MIQPAGRRIKRLRRAIATRVRLSPAGRLGVKGLDRLLGSSGRVLLKDALILRRRGHLDAAIAAFCRAADCRPVRRTALIELCHLLLDRGALAEARHAFAALAQLERDDWEVEDLRGRVAMAQEDFAAARDCYRHVIADMPAEGGRPSVYGRAVYMESLNDDGRGALYALACCAASPNGGMRIARASAPDRAIADIVAHLANAVRELAGPRIVLGRRTAVYFLDPGATLGHAVLEPFYLRNLVGHSHDRIVVVGPRLDELSAAARVGVAVSTAGLVYLESSDAVLRLAGQVEAGQRQAGELDLLFHNYHGLARAMFAARLDGAHPAHVKRRYLDLPEPMRQAADAFLRTAGIGPDEPIVAIHVRSHLRERRDWADDDFRNSDIRLYEAAIRDLLARGMVVVRLGDSRSPPLAIGSRRYIELPRAPGYQPLLDPAIVHRARFMISTQSGPCAYARAFAVPNLMTNAYMGYTTLPERHELLCFRPHWRTVDGKRARLDAATILRERLHRFQMDSALKAAGLSFGDLAPATIQAAVAEMLAWLDDPGRPESAPQRRFRELCLAASQPNEHGHRGIVAGFVGYGLPEARLSDAAVAGDPGFA